MRDIDEVLRAKFKDAVQIGHESKTSITPGVGLTLAYRDNALVVTFKDEIYLVPESNIASLKPKMRVVPKEAKKVG